MSFANGAEGITNGQTLTNGSTANTAGTGTAANAVAVAAGDSITATSSAALYGTRGWRFALAAAGAGATRILWDNGSAVTGRWAQYATYRTSGTGDGQLEDVMHVRHSGGNCGFLVLTSAGRLQLLNAAGGNTNLTGSLSPLALLPNHWYGICVVRQKGTGTGDGRLGYAYYDLESSDPTGIVHSWEATNVDAGTADSRVGAFGRSTGRTLAHTIDYDDIRGDALASGFMGPAIADLAVTIRDNQAVFEIEGGTPPYTATQTSGPATTAVIRDDGLISGMGTIRIPKHATTNTEWSVLDDNAVTVASLTVLPLPAGSSGLVQYDGSW